MGIPATYGRWLLAPVLAWSGAMVMLNGKPLWIVVSKFTCQFAIGVLDCRVRRTPPEWHLIDNVGYEAVA